MAAPQRVPPPAVLDFRRGRARKASACSRRRAADFDPRVVERAYRRQRAKRHARVERLRERGHANLRFWLVIIILVSLSVYLALTVWQELQAIFGL